MKRFSIFFIIAFLTACSSAVNDASRCPLISIPRETARVYQTDGSADKFQINLVGYESYCYTEPADNRRYAMITPIFKVRRLESSNITALDINFYVKTSVNAEDYLGIRQFNQVLNIPLSAKEITVRGRQTKTRITKQPYKNFSINLGIAMTKAEKSKADKMLDIDYSYLSEEEISPANEIDEIYLDIAPDEKVIYSEFDKKPIVVKNDYIQNNCCD